MRSSDLHNISKLYLESMHWQDEVEPLPDALKGSDLQTIVILEYSDPENILGEWSGKWSSQLHDEIAKDLEWGDSNKFEHWTDAIISKPYWRIYENSNILDGVCAVVVDSTFPVHVAIKQAIELIKSGGYDVAMRNYYNNHK